MRHLCFILIIDLLKQLAQRMAPVAMEHSSKLGKGADVCEEAKKQIREAISFTDVRNDRARSVLLLLR